MLMLSDEAETHPATDFYKKAEQNLRIMTYL